MITRYLFLARSSLRQSMCGKEPVCGIGRYCDDQADAAVSPAHHELSFATALFAQSGIVRPGVTRFVGFVLPVLVVDDLPRYAEYHDEHDDRELKKYHGSVRFA